MNLKKYIKSLPYPMCLIDEKGKMFIASDALRQIIKYDTSLSRDVREALGIKYETILSNLDGEEGFKIHNGDKTYIVKATRFGGTGSAGIELRFMEEETETPKQEDDGGVPDDKAVMVLADIDNFDELLNSTNENKHAAMLSGIDKAIRDWGASMAACIAAQGRSRYFMVTDGKHLKEQEKLGFPILEELHDIPTEADFPTTISVGIAWDGDTAIATDKHMVQAIEMAKGRGGDQVVEKKGDSYFYFGGTTQSVEKRNKGRSGVIAQAMRGLIDSASRVIIMGHKNPDMDAFGSAIGIYRFVKTRGKEAYIVVNDYTDALDLMYQKVSEEGAYKIIDNEKAMQLLDPMSVVVMLDTHRTSMSECPELFDKAIRTVIIDHHRKSEDLKKRPTLAYMESYASSTSELVTEILQYTLDRKDITRMDAEALLSGIMVDTNFFSVKTGVRTYEAAAWLKRAGADSSKVKKYFQAREEIFKLKAKCCEAMELDEDGIAYSIYNGVSENAQIINSQVADEILTVRGAKASFVTSRGSDGKTYVSARSLGDVNVQLIMEAFGGGGHLNTAGTQLDISPEEALQAIKKYIAEMKTEQTEETDKTRREK